MRLELTIVFITLCVSYQNVVAQCCGGGSPIAGGAAQGVLQKHQLELAAYLQLFTSDKTMRGDTLSPIRLFELKQDLYQYSRISYGLTKELTMSVELGYYHDRTERLIGGFEIKGKGIGDLILFPRYDVFNIKKEKHTTELTLGLGMKIPVGEYDQKYVAYENPATGEKFEIIKAPAAQPTTGTNDFIFNLFFYRQYIKPQISFFLTTTYFMRGTNRIKQSFGDILDISLYASKSLYRNLNLVAQFRGEITQPLIDEVWISYEKNTGGKLLTFVPQINYQIFSCNLTINAAAQMPLYQYVNGTQIASKFLLRIGMIYRPFLK